MLEDSLKRKKYVAEIQIPWKALNIIPIENGEISFEIAIGDADDHFVQEGKIAWVNSKDPLLSDGIQYGQIILTSKENAKLEAVNRMISVKGSPIVDWQIDPFWRGIPAYKICKVVTGFVKDKYDLSGTIQSCWNKNNLYLLIQIADSNQNRIKKEKLKSEQTFLDYGWIEDEKGKKVWEMNVVNSKYAGGALKNHQVDTVLYLKKGRYTLKYTSDESHAFNNWDDEPPKNNFYGVVIYKP
jgi:hypothetical protein